MRRGFWVYLCVVILLVASGCQQKAGDALLVGEAIPVYHAAPFPMEDVKQIEIVNFVGKQAQISKELSARLHRAIQNNSMIKTVRRANRQQIVGARTDAVLDGYFDFKRDLFVLGGGEGKDEQVFELFSMSVVVRFLRVDRHFKPARLSLLYELPFTHSLRVEGMPSQEKTDGAMEALYEVILSQVMGTLSRSLVSEHRKLGGRDARVRSLMRKGEWVRVFELLNGKIYSKAKITADDYYNFALCMESMGDVKLREKANNYYSIALYNDPSMYEAAMGLARLEWGGYYRNTQEEDLFSVETSATNIPPFSGVAVLFVSGSSSWKYLDDDGSRALDVGAGNEGAFEIRRLCKGVVEGKLNRNSGWRHRPIQIDPTIDSVEALFAKTGGQIFAAEGTDYVLAIDVLEQGYRNDFKLSAKGSAPVIELSDSIQLLGTVIKTRPYLKIVGRVMGAASCRWTSDMDEVIGGIDPLAVRIRLLNEAADACIKGLRGQVAICSYPLPDVEPGLKRMIQAGAYIKARESIETRLKKHATMKFLTATQILNYEYALGLCYELGADERLERAEGHYKKAVSLDPENLLYLQALQRLRRKGKR